MNVQATPAPGAATTEPGPQAMPDLSIDYLKIGECIFAVTKVGDGIDIHAEVKEFYKGELEKVKKTLGESLVRGAAADWDAQLAKLTQARQTRTISIPPEMQGKVVMHHRDGGGVVEVKPIIYHPHLVIGTKSDFQRQECSTGAGSKFVGMPEGVALAVTIACDIYIPCAVAISPQTRKIYMVGAKTPHTMGGTDLCIGNSRFEDYASLDAMAMSRQVSVINLFSLAGSPIEFMGEAISLQEVLNDDTIVKVEQESRWNVSR